MYSRSAAAELRCEPRDELDDPPLDELELDPPGLLLEDELDDELLLELLDELVMGMLEPSRLAAQVNPQTSSAAIVSSFRVMSAPRSVSLLATELSV